MNAKRTFWILMISGSITLLFSLPFWLIFVEGNKPYPPWTRTIGIIIAALGIVLLILAGIVHKKLPDN